jgi:hypothetical protein
MRRRIMRSLAFVSTFLFCLVLTPFVPQAGDEAALKKAVDDVRADKKKIVAESLQLTGVESKAFWPLYEAYQEAIGKLIKRHAALIKMYAAEYENLSDQTAETLIAEFLDIETDKLTMKKAYVEKFSRFLSPKKVMKYFQLESKMEKGYEFELATNIPLVK